VGGQGSLRHQGEPGESLFVHDHGLAEVARVVDMAARRAPRQEAAKRLPHLGGTIGACDLDGRRSIELCDPGPSHFFGFCVQERHHPWAGIPPSSEGRV
jgi:hypothetical protein